MVRLTLRGQTALRVIVQCVGVAISAGGVAAFFSEARNALIIGEDFRIAGIVVKALCVVIPLIALGVLYRTTTVAKASSVASKVAALVIAIILIAVTTVRARLDLSASDEVDASTQPSVGAEPVTSSASPNMQSPSALTPSPAIIAPPISMVQVTAPTATPRIAQGSPPTFIPRASSNEVAALPLPTFFLPEQTASSVQEHHSLSIPQERPHPEANGRNREPTHPKESGANRPVERSNSASHIASKPNDNKPRKK